MKPKNPQDKKRMEYERNHYVIAEYPHAFRKNWPRKKTQTLNIPPFYSYLYFLRITLLVKKAQKAEK
jgi:hypothetical protein